MATLEKARQVFDPVARRYDAANRVISAGFDRLWRRRLAAACAAQKPARVLDVACGTGGVVFDLHAALGRDARTIGIDITDSMLRLAQEKSKTRGLRSQWLLADGVKIPFRRDSFDAVTISYGLRNLPALTPFFREARRVLKPGGRLWILEFSQPRSRWFRPFYFLYLKYLMPFLGGIITGRRDSYLYLAETVWKFPDQDGIKREMERSGFTQVRYRDNFKGTTAIHTGVVSK